jgi:parallel beta-helix repeat protein
MASRRVLSVVAAVGMWAGTTLAVAGPAAAVVVGCGQTITKSTVLTADVGPCPNNGIVVGANNITLDLNGHRVFGRSGAGDGAGVLLTGRRGVHVTNGTVTGFDGGVVIEGGGYNVVSRIRAVDNLGNSLGHNPPPGTGTLYGDGIALLATSNNRIVDNEASRNGPFSGIGLYEIPDAEHPAHPGYTGGPTENNLIQNNRVWDNQACRASGFCDNDGVRLEPGVGPGNVIFGNSVLRNSLDGISLFGNTTGNTVDQNHVEGNGFTGAVPGDGIRVFGFGNVIRNNRSLNNDAAGISVARRIGLGTGGFPATNPNGRNNRILYNTALGNGIWDLHDSNPDCDNNVWLGNVGEKAFQPCVLNP